MDRPACIATVSPLIAVSMTREIAGDTLNRSCSYALRIVERWATHALWSDEGVVAANVDVTANTPNTPSHFMRIGAPSLHEIMDMARECSTVIAGYGTENGFRVPFAMEPRTAPE